MQTKLSINAATLIVGESLLSVKVSFNDDNSKTYSYLCAHDVKVGDQVVVSGYQGKLKLVVVTEVNSALDLPLDVDYEYKLVLSVIDTTLHDEIVEARDTLKKSIEREQRASVLNSIKERIGITSENRLGKLLSSVKNKLPNFTNN